MWYSISALSPVPGATVPLSHCEAPVSLRPERSTELTPRAQAEGTGLRAKRDFLVFLLQGIERGCHAEIDFLNGYVVERSQEKGVLTLVNAAMTVMVWEVEAGTRPISPENLEELLHCCKRSAD